MKKPAWLSSLTRGLPPAYWLLWVGTLINRLGGLVIPFLTLYLTTRRQIPASRRRGATCVNATCAATGPGARETATSGEASGMIGLMHRRARNLVVALLILFAAFSAFAQESDRPLFKDFNWFEIMKLDPASAFNALWDHAAKYKAASYDQKAILDVLLDQYGAAKDLEKLFPYNAGVDVGSAQYPLTYDRQYSDRLSLPWTTLVKLNVRSAMQYILLEVLYTKGVPKSKGKVPTNWTLFAEYFRYYVVMKKAG